MTRKIIKKISDKICGIYKEIFKAPKMEEMKESKENNKKVTSLLLLQLEKFLEDFIIHLAATLRSPSWRILAK